MYLHQSGKQYDDWPRHIVSEKDHLLNPRIPKDLDPIREPVKKKKNVENKAISITFKNFGKFLKILEKIQRGDPWKKKLFEKNMV